MFKKQVYLLVVIILIIISLLILFILNTLYQNDIMNIKEIRLCIFDNAVKNKEYVFKDIENIKMALKVAEELKNFDTLNNKMTPLTPFSDIKYEIVYKNNTHNKKVYKDIRPLPELLNNLLDTVEGRKQSIPLLYENISNIDKITLNAHYPKLNTIEITDKSLIDRIMIGLQEYYLSDKIISKRTTSPLVSIEINSDILGCYLIYNDNDELINLLKENKLYNELAITSEDIIDFSLTKGNKTIEINDKKIIDMALEIAYDGSGTGEDIYIRATLNTANNAKLYANISKNNIPIEIEKLFES